MRVTDRWGRVGDRWVGAGVTDRWGAGDDEQNAAGAGVGGAAMPTCWTALASAHEQA